MSIRKSLAAAFLFSVLLTLPVHALEPIAQQPVTEGGINLLLLTYDTDPGPDFEEQIALDGQEYIFRELRQEERPGSAETREESQSVTVTSDSGDLNAIRKLLEDTMEYDVDGFTGSLLLDEDSIQVKKQANTYSYMVEDTRVFEGLPRADPYHLPKTVEKDGVTLRLAGIQWSPPSGESSDAYTATVRYTGIASGETVIGYTATAVYSGTVEKPSVSVEYIAVYEEVAPEVSSEPEPASMSESVSTEATPPADTPEKTADDEHKSTFPKIPASVFMAAGFILAGLLVVLVILAIIKKIRGKHGDDDERESGTNGRTRRRLPEHLAFMRRDSDPEDH